tara:strand:- start:3340 stop:3789 length:450 start_codon:yes stop_codon:yes gene_type:complete
MNKIKLYYSHYPFSHEIIDNIEKIIFSDLKKLIDINILIIKYLIYDLFNYNGKMNLSSQLNSQHKKADLILDICDKMLAKKYLSGKSGRDYLDGNKFKKKKIKLSFVDYNPYIFTKDISPYASIIDPICRYGIDHVKSKVMENTMKSKI